MPDNKFQYTLSLGSEADTSGYVEIIDKQKELDKATSKGGFSGQVEGTREYQESLEKATEATESASKATRESHPLLLKSARTRDEATASVKRHLKVVDDSTSSTKENTSTLKENINRLSKVALVSAAAAAAWHGVKMVLGSVSRALKINEAAMLDNVQAGEDAAIAELRAANLKQEAAKRAEQSIKDEADEIERLTSLLDLELSKIDEQTEAYKKNLLARIALQDADLALAVSKVNADDSLDEVQKLERIAALRKKHTADQQKLEQDAIVQQIEAERKKESEARNRLASIPDVQRDRVASLENQATQKDNQSQKLLELAKRLDGAVSGAAANANNLVKGEDSLADDFADFSSPEKYFDYIEARLKAIKDTGQVGGGLFEFDTSKFKSTMDAIQRGRDALAKQKELTGQAETNNQEADTIRQKAEAAKNALDAEKQRLQEVQQLADKRIADLKQELELQKQLSTRNTERTQVDDAAEIRRAKASQQETRRQQNERENKRRKKEREALEREAINAAGGAVRLLKQTPETKRFASAADAAAAKLEDGIDGDELGQVVDGMERIGNAVVLRDAAKEERFNQFVKRLQIVEQKIANGKEAR